MFFVFFLSLCISFVCYVLTLLTLDTFFSSFFDSLTCFTYISQFTFPFCIEAIFIFFLFFLLFNSSEWLLLLLLFLFILFLLSSAYHIQYSTHTGWSSFITFSSSISFYFKIDSDFLRWNDRVNIHACHHLNHIPCIPIDLLAFCFCFCNEKRKRQEWKSILKCKTKKYEYYNNKSFVWYS